MAQDLVLDHVAHDGQEPLAVLIIANDLFRSFPRAVTW